MSGVNLTPEETVGATIKASPDNAAPPATEQMADQASKDLHELTAATREGAVSLDRFTEALGDITKLRQKTSNIMDGSGGAQYDPADAMSYTELMEMDTVSDKHGEIKRLNDKVWFELGAKKAWALKKDQPAPSVEDCPSYRLLKLATGDVWNPATSGSGADWAPTGISSQPGELFRLANSVVGLFPRVTIPMGVKSWEIPIPVTASSVSVSGGATGTAPIAPIDTTAAVTNPDTGVITLYPAKHETDYLVTSIEEVEDATVAAVQVLVDEAGNALSDAWESAIINGQTSADAGLDAGNGPSAANGYAGADTTDIRAGLRVYCVVRGGVMEDAGNGVLGIDHFENAWSGMGKFGLSGDVVAIFPPKGVYDMVKATEIRPADAGLGTIRAGAFGLAPYGIPVFVSDHLPTNSNASGVVDAATTDRSVALIVNTSRWRVGVKRDYDIKIHDQGLEDVVHVRGWARHAIGWAPPNTDTHTACIYNIDS